MMISDFLPHKFSHEEFRAAVAESKGVRGFEVLRPDSFKIVIQEH